MKVKVEYAFAIEGDDLLEVSESLRDVEAAMSAVGEILQRKTFVEVVGRKNSRFVPLDVVPARS